MNLAVKFYATETNPENFPVYWPSQILELGESTVLPEEAGWSLMTPLQFSEYISAHQSEFNTWNNARTLTLSESETVRADIQSRMAYGEKVILDFREKTLHLSDEVGATLIIDLNEVINALYLGILKLAAYLLMNNANTTLDEPLFPEIEGSPSMREYYAAMIMEGDPS